MGDPAQSPQRIRFAEFELDLDTGELRTDGRKFDLQGQPFQILKLLLERPGRLITREELKTRLWPSETFVDFDHSLNKAVNRLRDALEDSADEPRYVETLPRRGYRFIAPVESLSGKRRRLRWGHVSLAVSGLVLLLVALVWKWPYFFPGRTPTPGAGRALAVVQIENLSGDPSLDWLGDGVAELLTTDLAQAKTIDVISTERVRGLIHRRIKEREYLPTEQAQEIARDAHADLFLSGEFFKLGTGLRLDVRVQDALSGRIVFANKVEGENAQAVFAMADRTTASILSQLAPGESAHPDVGASLTASLDALHAYEAGVGYYHRWLLADAEAAFRRAGQVDPQFAMAHYRLASVFFDDYPTARQEILRAATLAQRFPLPRLQKLLIQAAHLRYDGRPQEAEQVLRNVVAEFPREVEPRFLLRNVLYDQGRLADTKTVLVELLSVDERQPYAYSALSVADLAQGDLSGALAALDRYAALVPSNDPNPIDDRGDALAESGHYREAVAEYRKNLELNPSFMRGSYKETKLALAYLYEGEDSLAEASVRPAYERSGGVDQAIAAGVLGDIAVERGLFDRAVGYYARAASEFANHGSALAEAPLLKAAHIYFEQGRPDKALALGRRNTSPWAPGVRGIAYLLLDNEASAEEEFGILRNSLTPLVGGYAAEQTVVTYRLLAADYAGHWQRMTVDWPQLARKKKLLDLPVGRACLGAGALREAELHLRSTLDAQRRWGNNTEIAFHDYLSYTLAQFYLGRVLEEQGKKTEALDVYREFLSHFKNSTAHLPQIAEARAALKRLS